MSDRKVNPFAQRYQATRKEIGYLDNLVMKTDKIKETYHQLNLKFESDRRILLEKGTYTIRKNVTIPMGYTLFIAAGTTIRMAPGISFISYSPLHIRGTRESPVKIEALSSDKPFGVWAVNGSGDELNTVEYLDFSGGKSAFLSGSFYPGGLNFHNTNLEMKYSTLHHTHGHDGLSVKKGRVLLEFNHFHSNSTDHAALDYCRGVIRKNRFLDDSEDREGDAVDLSNSVFFVSHNLFAYFIDKGVSAGENSRCFLYKNTIRQNYIGVASKNHAYVMAMDNKFYDNSRGVAAYRKDQMYGGGFVYLMGNDFRINDQLYKVDKDSAVFTLSPDEYKAEFTRLIKAGKHDDLFTLFNEIIDRFKFNRVRIESFRVGNLEAEVDERNKIVFAALPTGADTTQDITCRTAQNDVAVYMKPVFYGNKKVSRDAGREQQMKAGEPYDFKDYVFYGKILLKRKSYLTEYDIYVTTGTLPIIEIDTSGEHGVPRVIKNEPRIPCKIRIFSLDKSARKKNASKDYTNTILDAEIEGRGKKLPKWKYGIELDKSFPLEGMNDSRKWVLESSFIEKSLMRNKVAFDLLEQFRLSASKQKIAVRSHFVEVILNGSYNGVYILMEHVNKSFIGLEEYDVNKEFNALMYRARNINANFMKSNFRPFYGKRYKKIPVGVQPLEKAADPIYGWHSGFEQRYPQKRKYGEHWRPLERFTRFVALATDSEFKQHIFYMLDRESYIDLWLFTLMVDDSDGLYKNRYIARHRGKDARWHIIPWDKDGIMGRMHDMSKRPHNLMLETHLFKRCLNVPYFVETFKLKWERLKGANIISTDNIYKMIDRNIRMLADAQKRNFLRWPVDYYRYPDKNNFEQEIAYTKEWIRERILFLDQQIEGIGEDATQ
ncbi:MAG: hypothetical protein GY765_31565, partial [bacterium]|nr:hypothetical protein [bacterium]